MTDAEFQAELDKQQAENQAAAQTSGNQQQLEKAKREVVAAVIASTKANMQHRENTTTKVDVQNDMADSEDINRAVEAINNVAVLLLAQGQQKPSVNMIDGTDLGQRFNDLGTTLTELLTELRNDTRQDESMQAVTKQLDTMLKQLKTLQVAPDPDVKKSLANIEKALSKLDLKPTVNVPTPKVTVQGKDVDLTPLVGLLEKISTTLDALPKEPDNDTEVVAGLNAVQGAITALRFPVPNYVLPFKGVDGEATQVQLDASGNLPISATLSGADGAIEDGANSAIRATVLNLTDSNPLTVGIVDTNGDQISSFGGGTQYTDAGTPPTHPVGTVPVYDNGGTWKSVSTTNKLPVATGLTQPTTPSDTQPVSASSLPLPTGAATSAKQPALGTAGTPSSDVITVQGKSGMTALTVDASGATVPVSGTFWQTTQPVSAASLPLPSGASTAAKQPALGTAGTASSDVLTVQGIASMTALKVDGTGGTFPVSGTVTANAGTGTFNIQSNASVNLAQVGGASTATGHGTASGSIRVELPTDGTGVVGLNAGSNLVGRVGIDQTTNGTTNAVVTVPATSGGLSYTSASVGATATAIKASAGQLYGYHLFNTTAAVAYVQIFNVASGSVTVGTTTPDLSIGIPASGGVTVNFDKGIAFSTAISFACTTTRTGSTGATCDVNFYYK